MDQDQLLNQNGSAETANSGVNAKQLDLFSVFTETAACHTEQEVLLDQQDVDSEQVHTLDATNLNQEEIPITDHSLMPWGMHKGKSMLDVPYSYLMDLYIKNRVDGEMLFYIEWKIDDVNKNGCRLQRPDGTLIHTDI